MSAIGTLPTLREIVRARVLLIRDYAFIRWCSSSIRTLSIAEQKIALQ
jgi:hypothetical protein